MEAALSLYTWLTLQSSDVERHIQAQPPPLRTRWFISKLECACLFEGAEQFFGWGWAGSGDVLAAALEGGAS